MQKYSSKDTSINSAKVPAIFRKIDWTDLTSQKNIDIGGGKYDTATEYLMQYGVSNIIYDPFNRSFNDNLRVVMDMAVNPADTATISNVLNVIREKEKRIEILKQAKRWARVTFIAVYEGDKSGVGKETKKGCWQENRKLADYTTEVMEIFPNVQITKGMIVAF